MHRVTKAIFSKDWENWEILKGRNLTAKTQPARLLITVFGSPVDTHLKWIQEKRAREDTLSEPCTKKHRIEDETDPIVPPEPDQPHQGKSSPEDGNSHPEAEDAPGFQRHGPKFLKLSAENQQWLRKVHTNLGHPHADRLRKTLQLQSCSQEILDAIDDFRCSTCHELQKPRIPRPAAVSEITEFNQCVGCDLVTWSNKEGKKHVFFHIIDMATCFHLAQPVYQTNQEALQDAFSRTWLHWAGPPQELVLDGESALCSEEFRNFTQRHSIQTRVVAAYAHWQMGKVERHGGIIQNMLDKYHHDRAITNPQEFEEALYQCCNAKNALSRAKGYTPEILVLGKSSRVPGSIVSEPYGPAQYLLVNPQAESTEFYQQLKRRETARKAFIETDNDQAVRRAMLRRVRPHRGHHAPGTYVMYWRQNRWCGPGRVIHQEDQHVVWLSHLGRIFRVAPEHVRLLSEREVQSSWKTLQEITPIEPPQRSGHGVFQYENLIPQTSVPTTHSPSSGEDIANHIPENNTPEVANHDTVANIPTSTSEQPDAEPDHSQTESNAPEAAIDTSGVDVPVPEDSSDEALISEDYWIIKGDKITRIHQRPRRAGFRPIDSHDCPIDVFLLADESQTQGKSFAGEEWIHNDAWPSDNDHWSKDNPWTGSTTFQIINTEVREENNDSVIHDAFVLHDDMCWECEIFLTGSDQEAIDARPSECVSLIASAAKRQRAEVRMTELTPEHRAEFQAAKEKEVSQWLDTETVRKILRSKIPMENILRTRWVLTWKALDPNDIQPGESQHKAKARLVVLGYEDPNIEDIPRDSPTLQKESRSLIIQYCASKRWEIQSFDIKTAFLRGSRRDERLLGIEPPQEMRNKMHLQEAEICELRKSAYGLVNAPYLWFQELREALIALKFVQCPLDPCLSSLPGLQGSIHGLIGIHVDDGLACGDSTFERTIKDLEKQFPFGSHRRKHFVFTGIQIDQDDQGNITLNQSEYINKIDPISIDRDRRRKNTLTINESERQGLRGLIGSLQYAATNTRPDIAARLSFLQSKINCATIQDLHDNRLLEDAKLHHRIQITYSPINIPDLRFVTYSDASFATREKQHSQKGHLVIATDKGIFEKQTVISSPIAWSSKKIDRVVASTLAAETYALSNAIDGMEWIRILWQWIVDTNCNWRKPADCLKSAPKSIAVVDCKSLFDVIVKNTTPQCKEHRTLLEAIVIKDRVQAGTQMHWVHSAAQLADSLTKVMDTSTLRSYLKHRRCCLHDMQAVLQDRADKKQQKTWLKSQIEQDMDVWILFIYFS